MEEEKLIKLLNSFKKDEITIDNALDKLKSLPFEDLGFVKIDNHRSLRTGFPEVIYGEGKTKEQVKIIVKSMIKENNTILITRCKKEHYDEVKKIVPNCVYNKISNTIVINEKEIINTDIKVVIATGGTSDLPVAEEAYVTARAFGCNVIKLIDVGVAGIHRLLDNKELLFDANVVIAIAGMEGALPSVIGGLVSCPVIAVPTSVGYGANFQGLTPLLAMLNSCASGIAVVNIDNGFGGGFMASTIVKQIEKGRK